METAANSTTPDDVVRAPAGEPAFVITRTTRGWAVLTPAGPERAADLVEAMCLADLVAEDLDASPEPGREARRAARGAASGQPAADPRDQQVADLQRTVAQLEHALATRVSTERAIGVLAVQLGTTPRAAFEQLRRDARSSGRPVHDLAREVLEALSPTAAPTAVPTTAPDVPVPAAAPPVESVPQAEPGHPAAPTSRRRVERARRHPVLVEGDH